MKISAILFLTIGAFCAAYVAWGVQTRHQRLAALEATKNGESLAVVLKRFGQPSFVEPHYNVAGYDSGGRSVCGESCWQRLWYQLPLSFGTESVVIDFNTRQAVIDKAQFSSP
jgi:hypothetical protein